MSAAAADSDRDATHYKVERKVNVQKLTEQRSVLQSVFEKVNGTGRKKGKLTEYSEREGGKLTGKENLNLRNVIFLYSESRF